jgi:hypothetical protein
MPTQCRMLGKRSDCPPPRSWLNRWQDYKSLDLQPQLLPSTTSSNQKTASHC